MSGQLVLIRHGESDWNVKGLWTGLTDVHLSPKGRAESVKLGQAIKDLKIEIVYCSKLIRTQETLKGIEAGLGKTIKQHKSSAALNERDYGIYTGQNKWQVQAEVGAAKFEKIRRGWDEIIPKGETLKDVYDRVLPFYLDTILPKLQAGNNVLLVAHGNSLRALMKYIENYSDEDIAKIEMNFGDILIYTVDRSGRQKTKQSRQIKS